MFKQQNKIEIHMKRLMFRLPVLTLLLAFVLAGCARKDIVILFDNDAHCTVKGYAHMAALKDEVRLHTPHVAVVSAGDFLQGDVVGSISRGQYIVDIMNEVPYDFVTVGNHEFDYSVPRMLDLTGQLSAKVLCCNFSRITSSREPITDNREPIYPSYTIRRYGPVSVAYVGVTTPTTFNSSTPTYFLDDQGQVCYSFHMDETISLVQQAVDEARSKGADYVVVISHLGDNTYPLSSRDLVKASHGIDVILDGHAHNVLNERLPDANGDTLILTSTGSKFLNIGKLTITKEGALNVELIPSVSSNANYIPCNDAVMKTICRIQSQIEEQVSEVVGYTELNLRDYDEKGNRLVRNSETEISCILADAMRWVGGTDLGCIHGGSIRAAVPKGNITLGEVMAVLPFNNSLASVRMTGSQLRDALEVSVATWPVENGDFHIFSGLRYTINPRVKSSVVFDENGFFASVGATRRVVKVEIEQPDGTWQPIDDKAVYTVSGLNYTLINCGAGGMFRFSEPIDYEPVKDTEILIRYLHHLGDTVRESSIVGRPRFEINAGK